jgi:acetate kinase
MAASLQLNILVINVGSSSVKTAVIDENGRQLANIKLEGIAESHSSLRVDGVTTRQNKCADHSAALQLIAIELKPYLPHIRAVGHRVVHGGEHFVQPSLLDNQVIASIEELVTLAPLHIPACVAAIRAARQLLPDVPHIAVFDTAFHACLPVYARMYALPKWVTEQLGIRRYGFHGISHESVTRLASLYLKRDLSELRIISCHLGNGCSMAAVKKGRCIETSMGMTPLEGLVMGSRPGDLDPGVMVYLQRELKLSVPELERLLNNESGLLGMTGSRDMHEIAQRVAEGDESAELAVQVFCHRIRKYLGAYAVVMGGVDAIIFTGGIGENHAFIRQRVLQDMDVLGVCIDEDLNQRVQVGADSRVAEISLSASSCRLLVATSDEEGLIAAQVMEIAQG